MWARVVGIGANLVQIPLVLHHLKTEAFGVWMTASGIIQLMSFADLGMGLGLQNRISVAYARDDHRSIVSLFQSGVKLFSLIAFFIFLSIPFIIWNAPWKSIFKSSDSALISQIPEAVSALLICFAFGLPCSLGAKLAVGVQRGHLVGIWSTVSAVISLLLVIAAGHLNLGLTGYFIIIGLSPIFLNVGAGLCAQDNLKLKLYVSTGGFKIPLRVTFVEGILFLLPQASISIINAAPIFVISATIGTSMLPCFALCQRLVQILSQVQQIPIISLWPAIAEASARGDSAWIKMAYLKSQKRAVFMGISSGVILAVFGGTAIRIWTQKPEVVPGVLLRTLFALWLMMSVGMSPIVILLNGTGRLRMQAVGGTLSCLAIILFLPISVKTFGPEGAIGLIIISSLAVGFPAAGIDAICLLRNAGRNSSDLQLDSDTGRFQNLPKG